MRLVDNRGGERLKEGLILVGILIMCVAELRGAPEGAKRLWPLVEAADLIADALDVLVVRLLVEDRWVVVRRGGLQMDVLDLRSWRLAFMRAVSPAFFHVISWP